MSNVFFITGTQEKYDALEKKREDTLYWITVQTPVGEALSLYKGNDLVGTAASATTTTSGLMSAIDKVKLDNIPDEIVTNLKAVDSSVVIAEEDDGIVGVKVQISKDKENILKLKKDGLFVPQDAVVEVPEYSIEKLTEPEGKSTTYKLKKIAKGETTYIGDAIAVPVIVEGNGLVASKGGFALQLATKDSAGAMSAADKNKLDAVAEALTWQDI